MREERHPLRHALVTKNTTGRVLGRKKEGNLLAGEAGSGSHADPDTKSEDDVVLRWGKARTSIPDHGGGKKRGKERASGCAPSKFEERTAIT